MKGKFFFLLFLISASQVYAQAVRNISYEDLNGDGRPDVAVMDADFIDWQGTVVSKGKVLVYDEDDDMQLSQDWKLCCDFDSDVWVFDADGDGGAELIIDFERKGGSIYATLYDDSTGNRKVSYFYNATNFQITENQYPTLTVLAEGSFWERNGKINFNLKFRGDGGIDIGQVYYWGGEKSVPDGKIDFNITVYDFDNDGDPDLEWRERGASMFMIDYDDKEASWSNYQFWPFLGSGYTSWERGYNMGVPPIQVDWEKARIVTITVMISDRNDDGNCFILTWSPIRMKEINPLAFENPFCFLDLAEDNDGIPEGIARIIQPNPGQDNDSGARYNWDLDNDGRLDFGISTYGGAENLYRIGEDYVSVVDYPSFSIITSRITEAPYWIFNREWKETLFTETNGLWDLGEGIYEPRRGGVGPLKMGFRSEISKKQVKPRLYFSPIDENLHLLNADEGVFLLSAKRTGTFLGGDFSREEYRLGNASFLKAIYYKNLNDDPYIDTWIYVEDNAPVKMLHYSKDFLIYSENRNIFLKSIHLKESSFEFVPPRNKKELEELNDKLGTLGWRLLDFRKKMKKEDSIVSVDISSPDFVNFESFFKKFPGETIKIDGGVLKDFNLTEKGFRFIFDCLPQCKLESPFEIKYDGPLTLGKYIFDSDGELKITRIAEPDLIVKDIFISKENPFEFEYITVTAAINYSGTLELSDVLVQFYESEKLVRNVTIPLLYPGEAKNVTIRLPVIKKSKEILVKIDPLNTIAESREDNNMAIREIHPIPREDPQPYERFKIGSSTQNIILVAALVFVMMSIVAYISSWVFRE